MRGRTTIFGGVGKGDERQFQEGGRDERGKRSAGGTPAEKGRFQIWKKKFWQSFDFSAGRKNHSCTIPEKERGDNFEREKGSLWRKKEIERSKQEKGKGGLFFIESKEWERKAPFLSRRRGASQARGRSKQKRTLP